MILEFLGRGLVKHKGELITTRKGLKRLAKKMMAIEEFAYDTETNTLRVKHPGEMDLVGLSISWGDDNTYYIPTGHKFEDRQLSDKDIRKYLKKPFERENVRIIGHNLKFDIHVLANIGINIKTLDIFDTMIARWLTNENVPKGLKDITGAFYNVPQTHFDECLKTVTKEEKLQVGLKASNKATFDLVKAEIAAPYAMADAYWTWRHYCDWCMEALKDEKMVSIYKQHMKFLWTLYSMERRGVNVDKERLEHMATMAKRDLDELEYQIAELTGVVINVNSNQQLAELLFGYKKTKDGKFVGNKEILEHSYNFPVQSKTAKGVPSTGDSSLIALSKLQYKKDRHKIEGLEALKLIRKYKKLAKLNNAFIKGLYAEIYADGKIHCSFNQVGTDSGRLSCSKPNLQQLPRPVELENPLSPKDFLIEKCGLKDEDLKDEDLKELSEALVIENEYPNGELNCSLKDLRDREFVEDYLSYIKQWRDRNEDALFWKKYEIRSCFISDNPDEEVIIAQDFSNLEMRLLAHFSKDPNLLETFGEEHDAHGATAVNMFALDCEPDEAKKKYKALRQIAKTLNFLDQGYLVA